MFLNHIMILTKLSGATRRLQNICTRHSFPIAIHTIHRKDLLKNFVNLSSTSWPVQLWIYSASSNHLILWPKNPTIEPS